MLLHRISWILSGIIVFTACAKNPLKVINAECGSSVSMNGTIANTSLTYTFKTCTHCKSLKDICNYIYFQGDTLCFSIQYNQDIEQAAVTAYFENPVTRATYKAERIEKLTKTVYGFLLVGSLLEKIFWEDINKNRYFKAVILPFTIHVIIEQLNQQVYHTLSGTLYVQFVD